MRGLRTLVVDDDKDFAESIADLLDLLGHEAHVALDGRRAVETYRTQHFDVVLMDVKMPEMNGTEAFRVLRGFAPNARVILMTGFTLDQELREVRRSGALGVMHKPLDVPELELILQRIQPDGPVLLIEEGTELGQGVGELLRDGGWKATAAHSPEEALRHFEAQRPQIIVLDLNPPGTGAVDILERLRAGGCTAPVVVLSSAGSRPRDVDGRLEAMSVSSVLDEPPDAAALASALRCALADRAA